MLYLADNAIHLLNNWSLTYSRDTLILLSVFSFTLFNYKMDTSMISGDGRTLKAGLPKVFVLLRALSKSQNWPAGPDILAMK